MIALAFAAAAVATVTDTPQGFRTGPAKAPATLVEYASLNCPHCAHFSSFGTAEIMKRVRSGKLAFEYRPFLIFPQDVPATLIAKCVPASRRFAFIQDYYRNVDAVRQRLQAANRDELNAARDAGMPVLSRKLADVGQMKPIAARYGLTAAAVNQCVSDPKRLKWLETAQEAARAAGVTGTPTFELNGQRVQLDSLEDVQARLPK